MNWTPDKLIALALVIGCLALVFTGRNSSVIAILSMAAAYFFGATIEHYRHDDAARPHRDLDDLE